MAEMFEAIDTCPVPVIARVHGAALGGGMGLCAVADIVIAESGSAVRVHRDAPRDPARRDRAVRHRQDRRDPRAGAVPGRSPVRCHPRAADRPRPRDRRGRGGARRRRGRRGRRHPARPGRPPPGRPRRSSARSAGCRHGSSKWHTARVIARQRRSAEAQEGFRAFDEKRRPSLGGRRIVPSVPFPDGTLGPLRHVVRTRQSRQTWPE